MTQQLSPDQIAAIVAQNRVLKTEIEALKSQGDARVSAHDLSPAQYAASVGLSPETLERAARLAEAEYITNYEVIAECDPDVAEELVSYMVGAILAALPVLVPALREALVQKMMADAEFDDISTTQFGAVGEPLVEWLSRYLPDAEEGAS